MIWLTKSKFYPLSLSLEAFVTTKQKGMGLRLAISKAIITKHGGRIWAASDPGTGSTFCFTLPSADND